MSEKMHVYVCMRGDKTVYVLDRKTKPKMGAVITAYGSRWQVWYIEDLPGQQRGLCRARLEPYHGDFK